MKFVNVKKFAASTTKFINEEEDIVITRYGKPIAILSKVKPESPEEIFLRLKKIVEDAGVKKEEMLKALELLRKEIYAQGSN